ncbi:shikimate kinase [Candidatus Saganbacteria bacterium]|uniref:Shikimate kinase n=1 Tax=Candidatus Saganbacteria bacterium TaxID=2575572 RepID=A0A9D6UJN1_UNCSA|nr:shikimate kinase [Candidatus Saganbacteria bacterium]
MGSGKSAVGHRLAEELKMDFLDTDELIEKTEERKISGIFRGEGEEHFRELETEVLKTLQNYDNFVLSTGGGMVLREENVSLLKEIGRVILLWAEPEVIYERIKDETHRPLLQVKDPAEEIRKLLSYRRPFYEQGADFKIDTAKKKIEQIAKEIIAWLKSK